MRKKKSQGTPTRVDKSQETAAGPDIAQDAAEAVDNLQLPNAVDSALNGDDMPPNSVYKLAWIRVEPSAYVPIEATYEWAIKWKGKLGLIHTGTGDTIAIRYNTTSADTAADGKSVLFYLFDDDSGLPGNPARWAFEVKPRKYPQGGKLCTIGCYADGSTATMDVQGLATKE
jgi:hypothetical protein